MLPQIHSGGAERLVLSPLEGFSAYGRKLFCAAVDHDLGEAEGRLHSDGDLVAAVTAGDAERVCAVLAQGAPIDAPCRFNDGASALHLTILLHPELIEPLLEAGADVNAATLSGSTPLMAAASAGLASDSIARLIRAGADVHAGDRLGFTAAHVAAQFGKVGALAALVEHGAILSTTTDEGLTPLHVASGTGQREAVEWMVAHGLDPRAPSPLGDPLAIAEENGHQEIARILRGC